MNDVEKDDLTDLQKALTRRMDNIHKLFAAIEYRYVKEAV